MFKRDQHTAFSEILGSIYDAALHQSHWTNALDKIDKNLDGVAPIICIANQAAPASNQILTRSSWQEANIDYEQHYTEMNPWVPYFASCATPGTPIRGEEIITYRQLHQTEFYNDFFRKLGEWEAVIGIVAKKTKVSSVVFGLHCSRERIERSHDQLELLSITIAPHLSRSVEFSGLLQNKNILKATVEGVLNSMSCAALIIDSQYRVEYLNHLADTLFQSKALRLDPFRGLRITQDELANSYFRSAIDQVMKYKNRDNAFPNHIACPVIRKYNVENFSELFITVYRCSSMDNGQLSLSIEDNKRALVLVRDTAPPARIPSSILQDLYNLTPREADIAGSLAQGSTIEKCAIERKIAHNTIKTHVKRIFSKVGVSRQTELIAKLTKILS